MCSPTGMKPVPYSTPIVEMRPTGPPVAASMMPRSSIVVVVLPLVPVTPVTSIFFVGRPHQDAAR